MIDHKEVGREVCPRHGEYAALEIRGIQTGCPRCAAEQLQSDLAAQDVAFAREHEALKGQSVIAGANIPPRFRDKTFANYRADSRGQKLALTVCQRYVELFDDCLAKGRCITLVGKSGTGKTHLACATAAAVAAKGHSALFIEVYALLDEIKENAFHGEGSEQGEIKRFSQGYDLLVLDEVGAQLGTDWERATLFKVINNRYKAMLPTIMISNVEHAEFIAYVGDRVYDRLQENGGATVVFDWESQRRAAQ